MLAFNVCKAYVGRGGDQMTSGSVTVIGVPDGATGAINALAR